jgi:hypothetical protein
MIISLLLCLALLLGYLTSVPPLFTLLLIFVSTFPFPISHFPFFPFSSLYVRAKAIQVIYPLQGIADIAALEEKCKKEIVPRGGTTIYQGLKLALEDFSTKSFSNINKNKEINNEVENNNSKNNVEERIALVMLLSDGQDTSITIDGLVCSLQDVIQNFGFAYFC